MTSHLCTSREESGQSGQQPPGHVQQGSPAARRPEERGEAGETPRPFHLYVLTSTVKTLDWFQRWNSGSLVFSHLGRS